jgi:lipopolysaccharide/colanic/teichoic acid biosynthesis glycosyltransferase
VKRAFDTAASLLGLVLLAPAFAAIAAVIKRDSSGPVFFTQQRVGRGGEPFRIIKFRTMVVDARGPNVGGADDPRVTRVGALLRRCFLDEAPQLINVLRGEMSLVGPRPETPEYVAALNEEERRVLAVRPGMAGPSTLAYSGGEAALLAGRGDPDRYYRERLLHERVAADLRYVPGLRADLRILGRTTGMIAAALADCFNPSRGGDQ